MKITVWKKRVKKECKEKRKAKRILLGYKADEPIKSAWVKPGGAR